MRQITNRLRIGPALRSFIGRRILGAFTLILGMIVLNAGVTYLMLARLNDAVLQERAATSQQILLDHLSFMLQNQRSTYEPLIWNQLTQPTALSSPTQANIAVLRDLAQLRDSYPGILDRGGALYDFFESATALAAMYQQAGTLAMQSPPDFTQAETIWRNHQDLVNNTPLLLQHFRDQVALQRNQLTQQQDEARATALLVSIVLGVISIVLAIILAVMLTRQIVQPVAQLKEALQSVASGDLSSRNLIYGRDEIGDLLTTFNVTLGRLRDLVAAIQNQAQVITSESGHLKEQAYVIGARTTQEAAAVQETLATIDELSHAAALIATSASEVADSTTLVRDAVADSRRVVQATTHEMGQLRQRVRAISEQIGTLADHALTIESVVSLIGEVASETHLLALNAAIEAAGAGPYGTRFSVIANQVQDLATQANTASEQIRLLIDNVRNAMGETVLISNEGVAEVDRGVLMVGDLERVHLQIESLVNRTMLLATHISQATQQQRDGSSQATTAVGQLALVARENQTQSQRTVDSAANLTAVAEYLREAAGQFRLDN
ncbi:MAG TPA: methyl-accepting chemotaxis protein [Chloroflexia bacterium]|nr:methyl-accepting chemotaxis protein [Chloroflexia bacterium]